MNAQRPTDIAYLACEGIQKSFGSHKVLDSFQLDFKQGEFLSLLGPSGCGKTTLLRILAGLEQADVGRIVLGRDDITKMPAAARGFGIVFQSYALYPNMNALENVCFGLRAKGVVEKVRTRLGKEMLARVGLKDCVAKYPAQLSGGQQQRVALARVMVLSPKLLLLDEPFSALDAKVRFQLRLQVREMQRELGITTLLVTHDQDEAMMVSDRIALMRKGMLEQIGTPRELYSKPSTEFVADFVGTMNFFHGEHIAEWSGMKSINVENHCLGIRPESFSIDPQCGAPYSLQAKLIDIEFRGASCRIVVQSKSSQRILADLNPHDALVNQLVIGQSITLYVKHQSVLCFQNGILQEFKP